MGWSPLSCRMEISQQQQQNQRINMLPEIDALDKQLNSGSESVSTIDRFAMMFHQCNAKRSKQFIQTVAFLSHTAHLLSPPSLPLGYPGHCERHASSDSQHTAEHSGPRWLLRNVAKIA